MLLCCHIWPLSYGGGATQRATINVSHPVINHHCCQHRHRQTCLQTHRHADRHRHAVCYKSQLLSQHYCHCGCQHFPHCRYFPLDSLSRPIITIYFQYIIIYNFYIFPIYYSCCRYRQSVQPNHNNTSSHSQSWQSLQLD